MTTTAPTIRRLTHYLVVPVLAMGLAIGSAAVANAALDMDGYVACLITTPGGLTPAQRDAYANGCCLANGGSMKPETGCSDDPRASQSGRNPLSDGAPTHVIQPLPLPGQGGPVTNPGSGGVS